MDELVRLAGLLADESRAVGAAVAAVEAALIAAAAGGGGGRVFAQEVVDEAADVRLVLRVVVRAPAGREAVAVAGRGRELAAAGLGPRASASASAGAASAARGRDGVSDLSTRHLAHGRRRRWRPVLLALPLVSRNNRREAAAGSAGKNRGSVGHSGGKTRGSGETRSPSLAVESLGGLAVARPPPATRENGERQRAPRTELDDEAAGG